MTRAYPPLRVVEVIFGGDYEIEKKTTLQYIQKFGFNMADGTPKVRGAGWAGLNSKPPHSVASTAMEIAALNLGTSETRFGQLGHSTTSESGS